jgi:hypothetical protein
MIWHPFVSRHIPRQKNVSGARCDPEVVSALDACASHANETAVGLRRKAGKRPPTRDCVPRRLALFPAPPDQLIDVQRASLRSSTNGYATGRNKERKQAQEKSHRGPQKPRWPNRLASHNGLAVRKYLGKYLSQWVHEKAAAQGLVCAAARGSQLGSSSVSREKKGASSGGVGV